MTSSPHAVEYPRVTRRDQNPATRPKCAYGITGETHNPSKAASDVYASHVHGQKSGLVNLQTRKSLEDDVQ